MLFYVYYIKNSEKNELLNILKKLFLDIKKKKKERSKFYIFNYFAIMKMNNKRLEYIIAGLIDGILLHFTKDLQVKCIFIQRWIKHCPENVVSKCVQTVL